MKSLKIFSSLFWWALLASVIAAPPAAAHSPIPASAKVEKLATGFLQPEGPVWVDSLGILFSDIQANKIYCWSPKDSSLKTYLYPSDSSNGLTLDLQGRLILTQMEKRRVARREPDGTITVLASSYNGKKLNSPNDIIVKSDGTIFFTDPDFNIPGGLSSELKFQGIYRIDTSGNLKLLDKTLNKPNGLCFSPDESKLYVDESAKDSIYIWDVISKDSIANKHGFFHVPMSGYADGMKVDPSGNLYCSAPTGVWVISPSGVCLDTIYISKDSSASNCNWGDADRKTLYITYGKSLYRIRLAAATGIQSQTLSANMVTLYQNYPNPFNPTTQIEYILPSQAPVTLEVYDILGNCIAVLVHEHQSAGTHTLQWNAGRCSSGIYFLRLYAGSAVTMQKLVLLK